MSLFSRKEIEKKNHPEHKDNSKVIMLDGYKEHKVYVYNAVPLQNIRNGVPIELEASFIPIRMHSLTTDNIWDSEIDGGYAVLYKGIPIGMCDYSDELLHDASNAGYSFKFAAVRNGDYQKGIPNIKLTVPKNDELKTWWRIQSGQKIHYGEKPTKITLPENCWLKNTLATMDSKSIDLNIELIEKDSKNKHVLIKDGNIPLFEVTAQASDYRKLARLAGSSFKMASYRVCTNNGNLYYEIEFLQ